jgi:hypothetical protein
MAARNVRAGLGLHGLAVRALDPLALGAHPLDDEARAGLEQREGAVGVVAEGGDLGAAVKTVKVHRGRMMKKMGVTTVVDLVHLVSYLRAAAERPLGSDGT